ncbi:MAG TPA: hypothetical protein VI341_05855 [Actinomycetota bacterium]
MSRSKPGRPRRGAYLVYLFSCLAFFAFIGAVGWILAKGTGNVAVASAWAVLVALFVPALLYPLFFLEEDQAAEFRRKLYRVCIVLALTMVAASLAFIVFLVVSD